jgi:predicted nucleic acid-binding protein
MEPPRQILLTISMVSFNTNVLVYATASISDVKVIRARDLVARAMRAVSSVLLLQTLAEFSHVAIRKARIPIKEIRRTIDAWRAVLPVQAADESDLLAALEAARAHRLAFWDAMLWASAQRAGVRHSAYRRFARRFRAATRHIHQSIQTRKRPTDR